MERHRHFDLLPPPALASPLPDDRSFLYSLQLLRRVHYPDHLFVTRSYDPVHRRHNILPSTHQPTTTIMSSQSASSPAETPLAQQYHRSITSRISHHFTGNQLYKDANMEPTSIIQATQNSAPASPVMDDMPKLPSSGQYLFPGIGLETCSGQDRGPGTAPVDGGEEYYWYCCECGYGGNSHLNAGCSVCHNHWQCYNCKVEVIKQK